MNTICNIVIPGEQVLHSSIITKYLCVMDGNSRHVAHISWKVKKSKFAMAFDPNVLNR